MRGLLKTLGALFAASVLTATGWAETIVVNQEIIGINFTTNEKSMSAEANSREEWGYYSQEKSQGGLLAENKWQNFTSLTQNASYTIQTAGNPSLSVRLKKTTNNAVWGPGSGNSFSTENKLLGDYLDNGSTLEFYGLPASGYDVAIIFAGDGGKFSCVTVNGTDKTYNANGELVNGTSSWGDRKTGAADLKQLTTTGTATAGQVMYLANLNAETLKLQTVNNPNNNNVGRGTIAAIQIYLKSGLFKKPSPVWTWDGAGGTDSGEKINDIPVYTVSGKVINADNAIPGGIPAKNFTFSMWTKKTSHPNWEDVCGFSDTTHQFKLEENTNGGLYVYGTAHGLNTDATPKFISTADYTADRLQLLTVVQKNGIVKGYINGELKMTTLESTAWGNLKSDDATMKYFAWGCSPTTGGGVDRGLSISAADVRIYNVALSDAQVETLYNSYFTLSMSADTDGSGALSWSEITAAVGNRTTWNVSGNVTVQLDADINPALTALTLNPVNASGDSLTIAGTGSLWADDAVFALTTDIPVDVTNNKNNPRITLSGTGNVIIRKPTTGGGGIVPTSNDYSGTLTVDDGQQITRMYDELSIPFTVGEGGAKLDANGRRWHVSSKISGSGPLAVVGPSGSGDDNNIVVFSSNTTDHTGPITVTEGRVRLGSNTDWNGRGEDTAFGDQTTITVNEGAMCRLHYGDNATSANFVFEGNTTFGNVDGHATLNGTITVNGSSVKPVAFPFRWDKTITVNGKLSGEGTLTLTNPSNGGWGAWKLTNTANDFSGTIKLGGNLTRLTLTEDGTFATGHVEFGAAGELVLNANNSIAGLSGTAGTVVSNNSTERTLTLKGDSDVRNLTFTNVNLAIASGETWITPITKATVATDATAKVVLTADQKLSGLTLANVTVNGGTVVFLDADGTTVLQSANSNVYAAARECTYTVAEGAWNTEPENDDAIILDFGELTGRTLDTTILPNGVTRLAKITITGSNARVAASLLACADTIESATAWSLVGGAEESVEVSSVISGAGQVKIASGKVTFPNAKTYTSGTDIAAGATLTITNAEALGTGAITGAGTLVCDGVIPANKNGLTAETWTGTVSIVDFTGLNTQGAPELDLDAYGSSTSLVQLTNVTGWVDGGTTVQNLRLEGSGLKLNNGSTSALKTVTVEHLTGSGTFSGSTGRAWMYRFVVKSLTQDNETFTGSINLSADTYTNTHVLLGTEDTTLAEAGKIVVATDTTIATGATWSGRAGLTILENTTLTVNGEITGAIANAGTLIYGVDTMATNAISGAGAIQVAAEKTVDLMSATLTHFTGTYSVDDNAILKLPLAATAGKSIALGTGAKLLVVLNDEQKGAGQSVTVTGGGSVQFVDANYNVLCDGASYTAPIYTVGGSWTGANRFAGANIVIDFAGTENQTVDLATILGNVTALSKLTVKGTNGGTITKTGAGAVTATSTAINTNTTIDAGVANLGVVTIAEGKTLTVKDTATVSTLSGTGVYNLDLGNTSVGNYTFAADGKKYKVSSGTFTDATLRFSETQTNYEFAGGTITMATAQAGADHGNVDVGQFSFGTADVTISDGTINATHLITVQGGTGRSTAIEQTGGDIILSGTGDGSNTWMHKQTIMFGHWGGNGNSSYLLSGGSLVAEDGGVRFGNDSSATMTISGTGLLKVKGIKGKGEQTSSLTMTGGKLSLGDWGFSAINNFTFAVSGGEINAFGNATIAQAIALSGDVKLSAAEGKSLTINAPVTGTGTETLTLSGKIIFAVRPTNIGKLVFEEGAVLCFTEKISDDGEITLPTIEGTPTIKIIRADGETKVDANIVDGKATFTPLYSGKICWHDYEFNGNLDDAGYGNNALFRDSNRPNWSQGDSADGLAHPTDYKNLENGNYALYAATHPYESFTYPQEWTAVIVATLPEKENEILLAFGTRDGGTISLIKGQNADEVKLVRTTGNSKYEALATMTVPNATTAAHLYAFTKTARQIKIYLDGSLWLTYNAQSDITFGAGFQIASVHGGLGSTGMKQPEEAEAGVSYIDALRMYKAVLSQKAITALANEFPYNSPHGTYTRTVNGEVNWVEAGAWRKVNDNENTYESPAPGSTVILTAEEDATVVVNFDGNVSYEAITVNGDATVCFNKGTGKTGVIQNSGKTQINTNVTIAAGAVKIGAVDVAEGKTLTFDYSAYDFRNVWTSTIPLTGLATGKGTVAVTFPAEKPAQITEWACVKDPSTSTYAIVVTVDLSNLNGKLEATIENNAITWKVGNTGVTPPADLTAVESITMTVVGNNSVALTKDMTLASVVLTRSGDGAAAVTFGSGNKLTVTNTLKMNNVNVMATPNTLAAAVVMGTAGTETLTMDSQASYSHENKFAMRFENCAFTKSGAGTFPIASSGFVLDRVNVTLKNGALQLVIKDGVDPKIKDTTFTYVDADKNGVADGELTNHGWVHSTTTTTFVVPEGVTGKALVDSCLTDTGAVVKQGAGALELGVMKTDANPYTGATTIEAGTLVYNVTNNTANALVMQGAITVKAGATIKGSANCTLASLSLEDDAIIDATVAPVTATDVRLPTGDGDKVVLKKNTSGDVLTYTGETPNMDRFTAATTLENKKLGLGVKVNEGVVTLVLTQVSVPEVTLPDGATEAEIAKAQAEAEVAAQVVADVLAASTDEAKRTANVTAIENPGAASVIENVGVKLTQNEGEQTYTAKFTYNFGVSAIKVVALDLRNDVEGTELYVVVKAELADAYSFAEGVAVTMTDGEDAVAEVTSVTGMDGVTTTDAPTGNMRYFRFPMPTKLGTYSYKVRATNTTP